MTAQLLDIPAEEYHAIDAASQSMLKALDADPGKCHAQYVTKERPMDPSTPSQEWGSNLEAAVFGKLVTLPDELAELDGKEFERWKDAVVIPGTLLKSDGSRNPRNKDYAAFVAEHEGRLLVTEKELRIHEAEAGRYEQLDQFKAAHAGCRFVSAEAHKEFQRAVENIRRHKMAAKWMWDKGITHPTILWRDPETGIRCKAQLDRMLPRVTVDLKSAVDVSAKGFAMAIWRFGYHRQAAWYQDAREALEGERQPFAFVAVKNTFSYLVETYDVIPEVGELDPFIEQGREANRRSLRRLAECQATGEWVTETHGISTTLKPPRAARYDNEYRYQEA